jgi:uncharacterized membrane protein YcaP (DUF421 family)
MVLADSWSSVFVPDVNLLQIFVRTSVLYLFLVVMLRLVLRRQVGGLGTAEILVVVLLGDASQNAMTGNYNSITGGLVVISTLLFWTIVLDAAAYRWPAVERLVEHRPLRIIDEGRVNQRAKRKELLSDQELLSELRKRGIRRIDDVEAAVIEPDGQLSVVRRDHEDLDVEPPAPSTG